MNVKVEGLREAQMMLRELGAGQWSQNVLESYGRELEAKTKPYPSGPWKRTMNLSRQWYSTADKTKVTVGNRASYSGWVQQRATQAWFHRQHGWPTIEDRAESQQMELFFTRKVQQEVAKVLRKYG
jgi:hypothetical protein